MRMLVIPHFCSIIGMFALSYAHYVSSGKIRQDMSKKNRSWFRETPHRWPNDLLPLAYAFACVEVVAEKCEKAGKIYQQIIEGWGNPEVQGFFDSVNADIPDSAKDDVKHALLHPESFLLPDPNKPFRQLEDLFAKIKRDKITLADGIAKKFDNMGKRNQESFLKFIYLILDFITYGFNRESDIDKGQLRVQPDNDRLIMAVIMRTSADHQNIQLEQIRNAYKLRKHKGKVIDFHEELENKPTGQWHRKMVAQAKKYNLKLKNDRVIMAATKIKKYFERGTLPIKSIQFDHVIPRVARSSGKNVCRISLPKELDGKKVYVIVDMNNLNGIEDKGKEDRSIPKPLPSIPEAKTE